MPGVSAIVSFVGALAAVGGSYLALVLILLAARIPVVESAFGQDGLIAVHRRLGPWAVVLIAGHVAAVLAARTLDLGGSPVHQLWVMVTTQRWILAATVACALLVLVGITSWWRVRHRRARGTWWTIHLYTYLAIALAFGHQVTTGGPFLQGWARVWWTALYLLTVGAVLTWRVALPLVRSLHHDLRVDRVVPETADVASVWITGHDLDRWGARPGQFVTVRFWSTGLWWEGHPYSLSAPTRPDMLRVSIRGLGTPHV